MEINIRSLLSNLNHLIIAISGEKELNSLGDKRLISCFT